MSFNGVRGEFFPFVAIFVIGFIVGARSHALFDVPWYLCGLIGGVVLLILIPVIFAVISVFGRKRENEKNGVD